jgi:hypothetical protein
MQKFTCVTCFEQIDGKANAQVHRDLTAHVVAPTERPEPTITRGAGWAPMPRS